MFAMKVLAGRADTYDLDDIRFLADHLKINDVAQVVDRVKDYYPHRSVKPETVFMLEEILGR